MLDKKQNKKKKNKKKPKKQTNQVSSSQLVELIKLNWLLLLEADEETACADASAALPAASSGD